jgi:hypothetical protein
MRSDRHRPRRWEQFIDSVDLQAIELLLNFLTSASNLLAGDSETSDLAFMPTRVADDVRMSLEGLLSGYLQIASDAMRDIIETELLIRDFVLNPEQIDRWRSADENMLRRRFRPVHCRQRQANALGVHITEVPGATDYEAHSKLLHVRPPLLFPRSPESGHRAIRVLDALTDIMFHGISVVEALAALFSAINRSIPYPVTTLTALWASRDDAGTARAATAGIELAVAEFFSASGHQIVRVFESGLVIVINQETSHADFYSTNRIDFRRFHRDVSEKHPAPFTLTSLGGANGQEL